MQRVLSDHNHIHAKGALCDHKQRREEHHNTKDTCTIYIEGLSYHNHSHAKGLYVITTKDARNTITKKTQAQYIEGLSDHNHIYAKGALCDHKQGRVEHHKKKDTCTIYS